MRRFMVLALLVAGCGSNDNNNHQDGSVSPQHDAAIDAPPDTPPALTSALAVNDGATTITSWTAPNVFVNASVSTRLFVYNTSNTATAGAVTASFGGANASDFSVDASGTTCGAVLAAHDGCWIAVKFAPTAAGTKTATLSIAGSDAPLTVGISATALAPVTGLTTDLATVDFGTPNKGATVSKSIILENTGATTVTLGARTATAPFSYGNDNCPATLTPGAACTMNVTFSSTSVAHFAGTLTIASDGSPVTVPLQATTLRSITVTKLGDGTGTITSLPAGISCGATCSGSFVGGIDVQLIATPDTGMLFSQWTGLCVNATTTCTVPSPADGTVSSVFANATDKKINITFAGTGIGNVAVITNGISPQQECFSDCTVYVPSGTSVSMYGFSPSTWVGWTGDCTGTGVCNLGTVVNDRNVTTTNNKDLYEASTLFVPQAVTGVAVTSAGDLIIGGPNNVSKMSITGNVVWTTTLTDNVGGLAVDAADETFVVGDTSITKLSVTGAVVWTKPITANRQTYSNNPAVAVSADGTVIAVLTSTGLRALDANGDDRFSVTNASKPTSVAVAPDHTIALGEENTSIGDVPQVAFYLADGTPVTPYPVSGLINTVTAYDTNSNLMVVTSSSRAETASRYAGGAQSFNVYESIPGTYLIPNGVAATKSGELVKLRQYQNGIWYAGYKLDLYSSTGTVSYTTTKTFTSPNPGYNPGVQSSWLASGLAFGVSNRIVIGGSYGLHNGSRNWIQVLDLP